MKEDDEYDCTFKEVFPTLIAILRCLLKWHVWNKLFQK